MQMTKLIPILLLFSAIGCTSGSPVSDVSPMSTAHEMLQEIANSGVIGNQAKEIEAVLEKMKQTDGAKATQLIKQFNQLKGLKDVEKIKAAAGNIAAQL